MLADAHNARLAEKMTMWKVLLLALLVPLGCTKADPLYCDRFSPCAGADQVCDYEHRTCVARDGGGPDRGVPDTGVPDTGVPDTGVPDTGAADTGQGGTEGGAGDRGPDEAGAGDSGGDGELGPADASGETGGG